VVGGKGSTVTLLDICKGGVEHLNTKNIAQLEIELAALHTILTQLEVHLVAAGGGSSRRGGGGGGGSTRFAMAVDESLVRVRKATHNLLSLSVLGPKPPTMLGGATVEGIPALPTADELIASLPITRNKADAKKTLTALLGTVSRMLMMQEQAGAALHIELDAYSTALGLASAAATPTPTPAPAPAAFGGVDTPQLLEQPLAEIMLAYTIMSDTKTEESLREFLSAFKRHQTSLCTATDRLAATSA
jgi:hypothetical protein